MCGELDREILSCVSWLGWTRPDMTVCLVVKSLNQVSNFWWKKLAVVQG